MQVELYSPHLENTADLTVPNPVPTQLIDRRQNSIMGWVNVASRNRDGAVPCYPRQCPSIATRLTQPGQERMPQTVEDEWPHFA